MFFNRTSLQTIMEDLYWLGDEAGQPLSLHLPHRPPIVCAGDWWPAPPRSCAVCFMQDEGRTTSGTGLSNDADKREDRRWSETERRAARLHPACPTVALWQPSMRSIRRKRPLTWEPPLRRVLVHIVRQIHGLTGAVRPQLHAPGALASSPTASRAEVGEQYRPTSSDMAGRVGSVPCRAARMRVPRASK